MNLTTFLRPLALVALTAGISLAAGEATPENEELDIVLRNDDKKTPPTRVIQDNYIAVVGKKGGEIKIPSYAVTDVLYSDRTSNYATALEKRDEGRYRLALLYFHRALEEMTQQKWAAEYCNFGMGNMLYMNGDYNGYTGKSGTVYAPPVEYFEKVLAANPKSRFLPEVLVKIPICLSEMGKLDEAEGKLKEAEARLKAYKDEVIRLESRYGDQADRAAAHLALADAKIAEKRVAAGGKYDEAKNRYLGARSKCIKFADLYSEAIDGLLRVLILAKDYEGTKSEAQSVIRKFEDEGDQRVAPVMPSAYFALGKAFFFQALDFGTKGQKINEQKGYAEARWNFLHVTTQYADNDEYVAMSHYFAGLCSDKLKAMEPEAADRSVRHWKLVADAFPKSEAGKLAVQALGERGIKVDVPDDKKPAAPAPKQPTPAAKQPAADPKKAAPAKK